MKICIHQRNYKTLGFAENENKILSALNDSEDNTLNLFSNLSITGSPLFMMNVYDGVCKESNKIGDNLCSSKKSFIVGTIAKDDNQIYNALVFVDKGEVKALSTKRALDRFDENFFEGNGIEVLRYNGQQIGFGFFDDLENFVKRGVEVQNLFLVKDILFDKDEDYNIELSGKYYAKKLSTNIVVISRVGAEGSWIFGGGSFVVNKKGELCSRLPEFDEADTFLDTNNLAETIYTRPCYEERIYNACVIGTKEYFAKNHQRHAVVGLSGGLDSAVVAVIGVEALGAENVTGVLMPSQYSSEHSVIDAIQSAKTLGIKYYTTAIKDMFDAVRKSLEPILSESLSALTEENIQARLRLVTLMAYAGQKKALMLNTSNKSESCVGYGTIYGDDSGAIGPIGDLFKTDVYRLARWINRGKEIVPWNSINKAPSAELHPGQKDSDSLPDYDILDEILKYHIEERMDVDALIKKGYDAQVVREVIHLYNINEWKRHQEAPALRLSKTCFITDFHNPIS